MFEDEIKMEERSSNWVPLAMALALVVSLIGGLVYFVLQSKRTMTEAEAHEAATSLLAARGPEKLHFHVGQVAPSVDEKPFDPHYKVLEKAGIVKLGKPTAKGLPVTLTEEGRKRLQACGATEEKNPDGTVAYTVPLAERKLVKVAKIEMVNPGRANIMYEWQWKPTEVGLVFDTESPSVRALSLWERLRLIEKYGAFSYKDAKVEKVGAALAWDDKTDTWKPYVE